VLQWALVRSVSEHFLFSGLLAKDVFGGLGVSILTVSNIQGVNKLKLMIIFDFFSFSEKNIAKIVNLQSRGYRLHQSVSNSRVKA
jgi:hypothetical protein